MVITKISIVCLLVKCALADAAASSQLDCTFLVIKWQLHFVLFFLTVMQTTWRERNQQTRIKSAKDALDKNPEYVLYAILQKHRLQKMKLFFCLHDSVKNIP